MKFIKSIILLLLSLLIITVFIGCTKNDSQETFSIDQFQNEIKARNYDFELKDAEKDFLKTTRKRMTIGKESLDIYLYNSNKEMEADADNIDMNGFGYNNGEDSIIIDWIAPPHFYKKGNIIVLYVGENDKIISDLNDIFGEQFIGPK